jgi:acyl carrier protein
VGTKAHGSAPSPWELSELLISEDLVGVPEVPVDLPLISSGLLASFDLMRLIVRIEERYGISVAAADLLPENFETCERITAMLERKAGGGRP